MADSQRNSVSDNNQHIPAEFGTGWIPVTEDLPKLPAVRGTKEALGDLMSPPVLCLDVAGKDNDHPFVASLMSNREEGLHWFDFAGCDSSVTVTHWKPLTALGGEA